MPNSAIFLGNDHAGTGVLDEGFETEGFAKCPRCKCQLKIYFLQSERASTITVGEKSGSSGKKCTVMLNDKNLQYSIVLNEDERRMEEGILEEGHTHSTAFRWLLQTLLQNP